jgi:hypothetical protein
VEEGHQAIGVDVDHVEVVVDEESDHGVGEVELEYQVESAVVEVDVVQRRG